MKRGKKQSKKQGTKGGMGTHEHAFGVKGQEHMENKDNEAPVDQSPVFPPRREDTRVFDPVCGMDVYPDDPRVLKVDRDGTAYHFCSTDCHQQFESYPETFAA